MRKAIVAITVLVSALIGLNAQEDNTKYVDPTIGNVAPFLVPTYPTFQLPNQMLRMFPIKKDYIADQVDAFPLQVAAHRRKGKFQMLLSLGEISNSVWNKKMVIDHDLEVVHPWHYSTYLIEDEIQVDFTPSKKSAIYKLSFPKGKQKNIHFKGPGDMTIHYNKKGFFTLQEKIIYTTKGTDPVKREMDVYAYLKLCDAKGNVIKDFSLNGGSGKYSISLEKNAPTTVFLKYAVSYVSKKQAAENFKIELTANDFESVKNAGKKAWEKVINQIQTEGGTTAQKRTFYTSLYRTYERMVDINEYGKYYSGYDAKIHKSDRAFYVDDWVWDTYRSQHPLRTILTPKMENDMLNSYTLMYEQSGSMPTFPQVHGNHMCMNVYHSGALFIDGYRKGLKDYDVKKAYEGIKKNLTEGTFIPWRQGVEKQPIDDFLHQKGYFPALHPGEKEPIAMMDDFEKRQAVAVTLGASYDFWALGELAKELGETQDQQIFAQKGKNYKNLWHKEQRLFMPKDEKGDWVDINPKSAGGKGYREYYDENNGWTYAWDVQHDIDGLTELLGGKKAAENRLDQLFREPLGMRKSDFYVNGSNSTGLVGQFSMGNEPSFHIPYLYNYFGAPWKTQKRTRFLLDVWFKDNIFGIPGDEDGGGMTAFVVFSSMGLYPMTPGLPFYDITSPIFKKTTINLKNGKQFVINAPAASKTAKYIQKAYLNGKEITVPFISHEAIMNGGELKLILGKYPNKDWGKNAKVPQY